MNNRLELREGDSGTLTLTGHASVVEVPYEIAGLYTETIRRGAFKRTLNEKPDVVLNVNHAGLPLARTRSGTLHLSEDDIGLAVLAELDATDPDVKNIAAKMRRGDLDELSFAFGVASQTWNGDYTERTIEAVNLGGGDVSVVSHAANPAATATLRANEGSATLEQRQRRAEDLGKRVYGPPPSFRGSTSTADFAAEARAHLAELDRWEVPSFDTGDVRRRELNMRSGMQRTGDPVIDARALLDRGREAQALAQQRDRERAEHIRGLEAGRSLNANAREIGLRNGW